MEKSQERHAAKVRFVAAIQRGLSKPEAIQEMGLLPISRSTVFRLRQRVHLMGGEAAQDGRHGHPSKQRGEVRTFLEETCRQDPHMPGYEIQTKLAERFPFQVSVSQINRVRATLGISNPSQCTKKNLNSPATKQEWQEGAGGLLLLAAVHETNLLSQLEAALPTKQCSSGRRQSSSQRLFDPQQALLLTLLFVPVVGLHRFWDLRSYTGRELVLLTNRSRPYNYRHTERFLAARFRNLMEITL